MWLKIGVSAGLMLSLVITAANGVRAQDLLLVPRSQLFSAVIGQEAGKVLAAAVNAYTLGKARRAELESIRAEIAKCGNNCSNELRSELKQRERDEGVLGSVIEDISIKTGSGFRGLDWVKTLLSVEPPKITPEQRAWMDMNALFNIIQSYFHACPVNTQEPQI